ncbi:hypothetical protein HAV38_04795 [Glaciimonas immobilis]|nr:hypothetical protein HAV38_04795 [Glaciimonas immobilis]
MLWTGAGIVIAETPDNSTAAENYSATSLKTKYTALGAQLTHNQFNRPLFLNSVESPSHLKGDIYAVVDYPFATVNTALNDPAHWCDVLNLHINIKYCQASAEKGGSNLLVSIGTKYDKPLYEAFQVKFSYGVVAITPDYFAVRLNAKTGPLGTSDYHIELEAVSLENGKTFLHMTYSYAYSFTGRMAMKSYLATIGRDKVGFTLQDATNNQSLKHPDYIGGVRGLIERNTMRYYLAIDSYLATLSAPSTAQREMRLEHWFSSTEQYSRQLHEMDRAAYLKMKHSEYLRQQKAPIQAPS